jgi:hypothetical protein
MSNYDFRITEITPEMAKQILENHNDNNRRISQLHVDWLTQQMTLGHWRFNGDPIRFAGNRLIDGQHRLAAIAKYGKPVKCLIAKGLDESVFSTIDSGKRRSTRDALDVSGERNTHVLSAALTVLHNYTNNCMMNTFSPSPDQMSTLLEKYPGIRESASKSGTFSVPGMPVSVSTCFHHLFGLRDENLRDDIFKKLKFGEMLNKKMPEYHLRGRLENASQKTAKMPKPVIAALLVKTWNYRRIGIDCNVLVWKPEIEEFPKMV